MTRVVTARTSNDLLIPYTSVFIQSYDEKIDYKIDYSSILGTTETITESDWAIVENQQLGRIAELTYSNPTNDDTTTNIFISTAPTLGYGNSFLISNTIHTNQSRKYTTDFCIECVGTPYDNDIPIPPEQENDPSNERLIIPFSYGDASPRTIVTLENRYLLKTSIQIENIFNDSGANATLKLGDGINSDRFMSVIQNNPYETATYSTRPGIMTGPSLDVVLTIQPSTATAGSGYIILEIN